MLILQKFLDQDAADHSGLLQKKICKSGLIHVTCLGFMVYGLWFMVYGLGV